MEKELFLRLVFWWIAIGLFVFTLLLFVSAPYGRHSRKGWGPMIPNKLGWVIMELPSLLLFSYFFLFGPGKPQPVAWVFFIIWVTHYTNRSLIFPFRTKTRGKEMPFLIAIFAVCFNIVNGSINGYYLSAYATSYTLDWLYDIRFIIGAIVFVSGVVINNTSDQILLNLRKSSENGYQIPNGGMFKYVSCPNFMGEIIEWTGFAIMAWSPAGLAFALWTFFNLVPRAIDHHKWYRAEFEEYPKTRKAVIPFLL